MNLAITQVPNLVMDGFAQVAIHANDVPDYSQDSAQLQFPPVNPEIINDAKGDNAGQSAGAPADLGAPPINTSGSPTPLPTSTPPSQTTPTPKTDPTPSATPLLGLPTLPPIIPTSIPILPTVDNIVPTVINIVPTVVNVVPTAVSNLPAAINNIPNAVLTQISPLVPFLH